MKTFLSLVRSFACTFCLAFGLCAIAVWTFWDAPNYNLIGGFTSIGIGMWLEQ